MQDSSLFPGFHSPDCSRSRAQSGSWLSIMVEMKESEMSHSCVYRKLALQAFLTGRGGAKGGQWIDTRLDVNMVRLTDGQ